jgi:hypothetical protein
MDALTGDCRKGSDGALPMGWQQGGVRNARGRSAVGRDDELWPRIVLRESALRRVRTPGHITPHAAVTEVAITCAAWAGRK